MVVVGCDVLQVESLELARDSATANHKREQAAAQRDAAQMAAQHKSAAAAWHTDLDWHKSEVRPTRCQATFLAAPDVLSWLLWLLGVLEMCPAKGVMLSAVELCQAGVGASAA